MKRYDRRQTPTSFTQRVGREYGYNLSRQEADFILWNLTGFPSFWSGDDPMGYLERQLSEIFREQERG